jgi:hypothetical protein
MLTISAKITYTATNSHQKPKHKFKLFGVLLGLTGAYRCDRCSLIDVSSNLYILIENTWYISIKTRTFKKK